jgi:hypothetical protein
MATLSSVPVRQAGGRLTLTTAVSILTSDVTASTTIYYTPDQNDLIAIPYSNGWDLAQFSELSQLTTDATKSPAAVAASSCYDLFVWNDAGTIRCTRGPAWTNDTTRSAGTGLTLVNGILVNTLSITNGPAALMGRYVGSVRSNAGSTIDCLFGGTAAGGSQAWIGIWNKDNRVPAGCMVSDSTASWTYNSQTFQSKNASNANRISMMRGQNYDAVFAVNNVNGNSGNSAASIAGIGLDATNALASRASEGSSYGDNVGVQSTMAAIYIGNPGTGFHFLQAIERANNAGTVGFSGTNPVSAFHAKITF